MSKPFKLKQFQIKGASSPLNQKSGWEEPSWYNKLNPMYYLFRSVDESTPGIGSTERKKLLNQMYDEMDESIETSSQVVKKELPTFILSDLPPEGMTGYGYDYDSQGNWVRIVRDDVPVDYLNYKFQKSDLKDEFKNHSFLQTDYYKRGVDEGFFETNQDRSYEVEEEKQSKSWKDRRGY
tara:strand:+ start:538 stop:1077 length:540 start_codon:yes stop_codon:yes gene_type:complete